MNPALLSHLIEVLEPHLGSGCEALEVEPVLGGDINTCYRIRLNLATVFAKTHTQASALAMYQAEAAGLQALEAKSTLSSPTPYCHGQWEGTAYLLMSHLDLQPGAHGAPLGEGLAELHRHNCAKEYGFDTDNFIGTSPQHNGWLPSWCEFWWQKRLQPQMTWALRHYPALSAWMRPLEAISQNLLEGHQPPASLVHGDLWSGNAGVTTTGEPTIFDPAVYYGDREVDIALTQLFGGFASAFYEGYTQSWPLDSEFSNRATLYNLYHLLNHLNLFGGGYLSQCLHSLEQLQRIAHRS